MGSSKQQSQSGGSSTTTVQRTEEERQLQALQLAQATAADPFQRQVNESGLKLVNQLMQGQSDLPGFLGQLAGGINEQQTQDIVQKSLRDINPQFAQSGLLDSGVRASVMGRTAGDIRRGVAEFNIGNLQNLLNLALSGSAQVQQPVLATSNTLAQSLAGARGTTTTSSQWANTRAVQPFAQTFQQITGGISNLGSAYGGAKGFMGCWVASEIFGGWDHPQTVASRFYINLMAPKWFKKLYLAFGEAFAKWIKNKPFVKSMIKPLFEKFARLGGYHGK